MVIKNLIKNNMKKMLLTAFFAVLIIFNVVAKDYDVVIAGGGTGGFSAAVQAARMGCNVLLLEETDWLGGQMSAAGVATMDEGTVGIRNHGIYQEFYHKADDYYKKLGKTVGTCYWNSESCAVEPAVGQALIYDMIKEVNKAGKGQIDVMLYAKVAAVFKEGEKITAVKIEKGLPDAKKAEKINCKILVDATEYGDVIPLTGAKYRIAKHVSGSIDNAAKVQDFTWTAIVKEYSAGIPEELKVKTPPKGYDAFKRHLSYIKRNTADDYNVYANPTSWNTVAYYRGLPNSETNGIDEYTTKTELNIAQNDVPVTVGDIEVAELRWKKEMELRKKTLCLIYYMQNELGLRWSVDVSQKYDSPYNKWLTNKMVNDFPDLKPYEAVLQHFPVMPYVRESRRIVGLHTLISTEIDRTKTPFAFKDAISINDYPEDLHGSKRPQDLDIDIDAGASSAAESHDWDSRTGAFYVPMRSFIPEKIDGFLAAEKNISQSRLVNGATRLQPSTMLNGQAVGNIAALSVRLGVQPRNIPAVLVQLEQLEAGAPLFGKPIIDLVKGTENWKSAQLCLINGLLNMPGKRFFPEDPIAKEDFEKILKEKNLKIETPKGVITRAFAAELFRNYLVAEANLMISKSK